MACALRSLFAVTMCFQFASAHAQEPIAAAGQPNALGQESPRKPASVSVQPNPDRVKLSGLLEAGNYRQLDAELSKYQEAYRTGAIRERVVALAIWALRSKDPDLEPVYDLWVAAKPNSYVARIARANYLMRRGYQARGTEYASKTSKAQFDAMRAYFGRSMSDLEAALKLDTMPVLAYATMIEIAMAGGERDDIRKYLDRAIMLDPQAYSPRRKYLETLAPEWGGSLERMAAAVEFWKSAMDGEPMERLIQVVENRKWEIALQPASDLVEQKRYREAIELYDRALAQAPVVRAYTMRGHSYAQLAQYDKALENYNRSLELDPDSSCCSGTRAGRGEVYLRLGAVDKALPDLMRAATDDDNAWAARELAMTYAFGKYGVKPDYSEARRWCERSAKEGDALSMYCMGSLYYTGLGVERDPVQAEKWLRAAAQRDIADAQADLGFFYMQGDGGTVNVSRGLYWWVRAAVHGNMRAIFQVGSIAVALGFLLILLGIWYSRYKKKTRSS